MSANDLQQPLLDAMKLLSQNAVNQDNAVKSIKATVVAVKDEGLNTYTVSYGGNEFEASATSANVKYQAGDIVYVLIPDGDFSQKKLIIGAVAARATMYSSTNQVNPYTVISNNLFGAINEIQLQSWNDEERIIDNLADFGTVLSEYLQTYKTICFSAKVRTNIDKDHQVKGNYGLRLTLPFTRVGADGQIEDVPKIFVMDVDSMQGNPYAFTKEQLVNLYFDIEDGLKYDTTKQPELKAFVKDFGYLEARTDIDYDIFIKDAGIQVVDSIPESAQDGYYLSIVTDKGNYFLVGEADGSRILSPVLKLDGKETSVDSWECYWFAEDASIKIGDEGYTAIGGLGWKCLNDKMNISYDDKGNQNYQYVLNKYKYAAKQQDVVASLKYKCVLVQDDVVVSALIELKNLNSKIEISLLSANGSSIYPENTGNVNLIARIYYPNMPLSISLDTEWQRFDKDGNYLSKDTYPYQIIRVNDPVIIDEKQVFETEIRFSTSSVDTLNLINCTFYQIDENAIKKSLGTANISISTSTELGYRVLINNGDIIYKYDADGDSPLVANYDGPVSSRIKEIKPISYRLFKDDGSELTEEDYRFCRYEFKVSKNSMITPKITPNSSTSEDEDYYSISGYGQKELGYSIDSFYNKRKSNNTILLTLEYAGNVINEAINIKFIKDGESGTNGTKYAAIIKYGDYAYGERDGNGKIRKLQAVYINGSGWKLYDIEHETLVDFGTPSLSVEVFKDGIPAEASDYSVSWKMFDAPAGVTQNVNKVNFSIDNTGKLSAVNDWTNAGDIYTNIVEAKVTVLSGQDAASRQELYVYYPIEITRLVNNSFANKLIPTLDGGFSEVLYASDGTNPAYDTTSSFVCTNNLLDDASNYYTYSWNTSSNLSNSDSTTKEAEITPEYKFESGDSSNYVKASIQMDLSQEAELNRLITEANIDIANINSEITYYQSEKQYVLDIPENFSYNNYKESLDNSQLLLLYILQGKDVFNSLITLGEEIIEYYNRQEVKSHLIINLEDIVNNNLTNINNEKIALHNLIKGGSLDSLTGLQNSVIVFTQNMSDDISIYYQVKSLIDRWNQLINVTYKAIYTALTRKTGGIYDFKTQIDNLKQNIYDKFRDFITNVLTPLATPVGGREPDQKFVNLKNNVTNLVNRLDDVNSTNSYADIDDKVIYPIYNLLTIYEDTDYQNSYYNNIFEKLNRNLTEKETERDSYTKAELPNTTDAIIHIRPIVMTYNRYELSNINSWDGNKLYIDENNQTYLLAPQVGAGYKDSSTNQFTGLVMGIKKANNTSDREVGLFGFSSGQQSIFLDAKTGNAEFGTTDKIKITPTTAEISFSSLNGKIYSGQHDELDKNSDGFYLSSDGLSIGYGFKVNEKGLLSLGGEDGKIVIDPGNQTRQTKFYSDDHDDYDDTDDGFYLAPDGLSIGRYFRVDEEGNLTATSGTFSGSLNGATGTFSGALNAATGTFSGDLSAAGGTFTGTLSADCLNGGTINGNYISVINLDASNITSGTIDSARIDTNTLTIYTESGAYKTILEDGDIKFYYNNSWSGYIRSIASGGLEVVPNGNIQLGQGYGHYVVIYGTLMNTAGQYYAYTTESTGIPRTGEITANYYSGTGNAIDFYNAHSKTPSGGPAVNSSQRAATVQYVDSKVSDFNLKYNIQNLFDIQNQYLRLRPVSFVYKDGVKETELGLHYGLIAQDVEDINQNLVYSMDSYPGSMIEKYCGSKFLNLKYEDLHAWHIQMIQKQHKEIEQLKQDIIYLKGELDIIKQKIGG